MQERSACVCDEVADVAARPAARTCLQHRERGRKGIRTVGGEQHAGVRSRLRIRACHVHGSLRVAKDNRRGEAFRAMRLLRWTTRCSNTCNRIVLPPSSYAAGKTQDRPIAGRRRSEFIKEREKLNETFDGSTCHDIGIVLQGGMYNARDPCPCSNCGLADVVRRFASAAVRDERDVSADSTTNSARFCADQALGADGRGRPAQFHRSTR